MPKGYRYSYRPLAHAGPIGPTIPLTAKIEHSLVDQVEAAARTLNIPRHHILKAALRLGVPHAVAELTTQAQVKGVATTDAPAAGKE